MPFPRLRLVSPRRMGFWQLGPGSLVAAVIERTADEPLVVACQEVTAGACVPPLPFAAGLLECARAIGALQLHHAVAIDRPYSRLRRFEPGDEAATAAPEDASFDAEDLLMVPVDGLDDGEVEASRKAVEHVARLFRDAGLSLDAVDCADCAALGLTAVLGGDRRQPPIARSGPAALDALAAVSVAPACEEAAVALGPRLSVVVGLALVRFGLVGHGHR
jgi:hypothetical protein